MRVSPRRAALLGLVVLAGAVCNACTSVDPEPFRQFAASVEQLREGADTAFETNAGLTRERTVKAAVEGTDDQKIDALDKLMLQPTSDPLGVDAATIPLFIKVRHFRTAAYQLNSAFFEYAQLLAQVAAPDLIKQSEFDQLTLDLNGNLYKSLSAIGRVREGETNAEAGPVDAKSIAIFSTAAVALAKEYLESRRADDLREVILKNQEKVSEYSSRGQEAIDTIGRLLRQNYQTRSGDLAAEAADPSKSKSVRTASVNALIELDLKHLRRLETLKGLRTGYGSLPEAHLQLAEAIEEGTITLSAVRALYAEGKRLKGVYETAFRASELRQLQSAVTASDAVAKQSRASADAATARARRARQRAGAKPDDVDLSRRADELEDRATKLGKLAEDAQTDTDARKKKLADFGN